MANTIVTITRASTSQLYQPLVVNLAVSGTATFSTDYTVSGATSFNATAASVTIPANQTSKTITLSSVADTVLEPNETVVLTVVPTAGISSGSGTVTWTILNDDVQFVFDGQPNSYIAVTNNALLNVGAGDFLISLNFNSTLASANLERNIFKRLDPTTAQGLSIRTNNKLSWWIDGVGDILPSSASVIVDRNVSNVLSISRLNGVTTFKTNGVASASFSNPQSYDFRGWALGRATYGANFIGTISDVYFTNNATANASTLLLYA